MKSGAQMQKGIDDLFERWHPFWKWEDLSMWQQRRNSADRIEECARVLADPVLCLRAMRQAVEAFPISAEQHLSKPYGRQPWMGQAACSAALDATEEETRLAWCGHMTPSEQASANGIADAVIREWEMACA